MKTYLKTLGRMFKKHITRFLSIIFIVLIAVGFSSGIGSSTTKIDTSLNDYYVDRSVADFIIKSSADEGFSQEDIDAVKQLFSDGEEGEEAIVRTGMSVDVELEYPDGNTYLTRLYFLDDFNADPEDWGVNLPQVISSYNYSGEGYVAYAQQGNKKIAGVKEGSQITLDFIDILNQLSVQNSGEPLNETYITMLERLIPEEQRAPSVTVTKTLQSPLLFAEDGEPSYVNGEDVEIPETGTGLGDLVTLENVLYMSSDILPVMSVFGVETELIPTGDIYVAIADRTLFANYSGGYKEYTEKMSGEITDMFTPEPAEGEEPAESTAQVITLYDNFSFFSLHSYSQKVEALSWVLVVAFIFVTALVVFSNISRLMEEERAQVACLRTLGYSAFKIIFKYALFAAIAAGIAGVAAYFVGSGISIFVYEVFGYSYVMPPMSAFFDVTFFLVVFCVIVAAIMFATLFSGIKMITETPANLLRPKPPKAGKKVIFERIPPLWNLLSFKYKSTVRNVLRYKSRFLMTVIAVAISMSLVMAGLAILDLCTTGVINSVSLVGISIMIIAFAGLLTAVVIYTLTNINISERSRELATLMVLGYYDGEVSGYIYREIYIDTLIGVIFGYPLAALLIWVVFDMIGLGTLGGISWYMWLVAPAVVALFTWIVTLVLRRKIVGVDMNESLKAIE